MSGVEAWGAICIPVNPKGVQWSWGRGSVEAIWVLHFQLKMIKIQNINTFCTIMYLHKCSIGLGERCPHSFGHSLKILPTPTPYVCFSITIILTVLVCACMSVCAFHFREICLIINSLFLLFSMPYSVFQSRILATSCLFLSGFWCIPECHTERAWVIFFLSSIFWAKHRRAHGAMSYVHLQIPFRLHPTACQYLWWITSRDWVNVSAK